jgi:uncharacterized protein YfaT (DUF1175 family)
VPLIHLRGNLPRKSLVAVFFLLGIAGCRRDHLILPRNTIVLPADGRIHTVVRLARQSGRELDRNSLKNSTAGLIFQEDGSGGALVSIVSPVTPRTEHPRFSWQGHDYSFSIRFTPDATDTFSDGTPDALRLHTRGDRQAFRNWFVAVAEEAASLPNDKVPPEINDCAALLRYSYREALRQHDERWFAAQADPTRFMSVASVSQYIYPQTPLKLALFRIKPGVYESSDPETGAFAQFADAHMLMALNTYQISRDIHAALPGDLLFFRQLEQNSPYHSMIVAGANSDWVIYHTGPINSQQGEIRRVAMQDLLHHPDARWRPVPENTNFLGVYRWNILREGN